MSNSDNIVVHFLAKEVVFGSELQVWVESFPENIAPLITCDFCNL